MLVSCVLTTGYVLVFWVTVRFKKECVTKHECLTFWYVVSMQKERV